MDSIRDSNSFFVIQMFVGNSNLYISSALSIFTVLFFLWFMDIIQTGGPRKKEKQIAIRPKAKPNRVKKISKIMCIIMIVNNFKIVNFKVIDYFIV